mmetsp:Transcript_42824/g.105191  ORF Transcript_42824/g.105191 Transcript_42824/m.105191 type:complete len:208 (+) Transcript_42824:2-625(+)
MLQIGSQEASSAAGTGGEPSSKSVSGASSPVWGSGSVPANSPPSRSTQTSPLAQGALSGTSTPKDTSPRFPSTPPGLPPKRVRKPKVYKDATASTYCHICQRARNLVICSNFRNGTCRKSICQKCFSNHDLGIDYETALARSATENVSGSGSSSAGRVAETAWYCTHCEGKCPPSARCVVYERAVERRRMKLLEEKLEQQMRRTKDE